MAHERKDIRDAVKAALLALPGASWGSRVYTTRKTEIEHVEMPCVTVYIDSDSVDGISTAPRELQRIANVVIHVDAAESSGTPIDDALDALALQVETAMDADVFLGDTAFSSWLSNTELEAFSEGRKITGVARLEYAVTYHTNLRKAPPSATFSRIDVKQNVNGTTDAPNRPEDLIEVPQ